MQQYRGAKVEVKHAEKLIVRILFLEGTLVFSEIEKMHIGEDIPLMFTNDHESEIDAVKRYNAGIIVCEIAKDNATKETLECILSDEKDAYVDS
jgi:bacterioferritin